MVGASDRTAGLKLIETGASVPFDIVETNIKEAPGGVFVEIELVLGEIEEDGEDTWRTEDHEWGGLGFMFCLAVLSFADARPRNASELDFASEDHFSVADLFDGLRYVRGELQYTGDYVRGRCLKTDITVRPNGTARLTTRCRGEAAVRWVQRLKGKKALELVK